MEYEKLADAADGVPSAEVQGRVEAARGRQRQRFAATNTNTKLAANADMTPLELREHCPVEPDAQALLRAAMKQLQLSARAFHRILKVSRTIADLAGPVLDSRGQVGRGYPVPAPRLELAIGVQQRAPKRLRHSYNRLRWGHK